MRIGGEVALGRSLAEVRTGETQQNNTLRSSWNNRMQSRAPVCVSRWPLEGHEHTHTQTHTQTQTGLSHWLIQSSVYGTLSGQTDPLLSTYHPEPPCGLRRDHDGCVLHKYFRWKLSAVVCKRAGKELLRTPSRFFSSHGFPLLFTSSHDTTYSRCFTVRNRALWPLLCAQWEHCCPVGLMSSCCSTKVQSLFSSKTNPSIHPSNHQSMSNYSKDTQKCGSISMASVAL